MLGIGTAPGANEARGTRYLAVGIGRELQIATGGVVDAGLVGINDVPVRTAQFITLELQGTLAEHDTDGVLTEGLVISYSVLQLPGIVVALEG